MHSNQTAAQVHVFVCMANAPRVLLHPIRVEPGEIRRVHLKRQRRARRQRVIPEDSTVPVLYLLSSFEATHGQCKSVYNRQQSTGAGAQQ